ncbi:autotransporter assembly complex family protein [Thalassobaculum sp. OXR-137]|uniref:autotransporter assembly complex protein TamA n=1 Tax=Thalassobaculum sp. OXR-137 TaxID=3100173 RepID=UPI002AC9EC62|nr:autotransporter assembly complex family protein [Thalassobaculum sp. OXR-137]WPZ35210.1 autotransporter assembly complex family protein [Thalassobaculum sp. OXR-137]
MRFASMLFLGLLLFAGGVRPAWAQADPAEEEQPGIVYEVSIEGLDGTGELKSLVEESSVLKSRIDDLPVSEAALERRAREDEEIFDSVARSLGYYDAVFVHRVDDPVDPGGPVRVLVYGDPGSVYTFDALTIRAAGKGGLPDGLDLPREDLAVERGAPAKSSAVVDAETNLIRLLQQQAYPLAKLADRTALIDRDAKTMDLVFEVDPGARARYGDIAVKGNDSIERDYIVRRLPWTYGAPVDMREIDKGRRALVSTGRFDSAGIQIGDAVADDGSLPITVTVRERPARSIGAGISYSTSEGLGTSAHWEHRNLFGGAEKLRIETTVAEVETSLTGAFTIPDVLVTDQNFTIESGYIQQYTDGYDSESYTLGGRFDRRISDMLSVDYGLSLERSRIEEDGQEQRFTLVGIPLGASIDTSNDLLNPTRGGRTRIKFTPYLESLGSTLSFYSTSVRHAHYLALDDEGDLVLAGRAGIGTIFGASTGNLPADKRFYTGGSGSVRGYALQSVGPLDASNEPTGGSALLDFGAELRWRVYGDFGIVPFIDAGQVYDQEVPTLDGDLQWGAGLGFRYFTAIGPIRADIAFPLNPRDSDDAFQVYFSLGQAF